MKKKRKNSNYKISFETETNGKGKANNKLLISFVCIFLVLVLTLGIIFGVSEILKRQDAIVEYDGEVLTRAEVSFFSSYYKAQLIQSLKSNGIAAEDTEAFWASDCPIADNYGELLKYNTREYLKQIIVANRLFDKYDYLSKDEKREIKTASEEILTYRAGGDVDKFNEETEKYGFTYDDFEGIVTKMYKFAKAGSAVFGSDTTKIKQETELCDTYFAEYSKVKLLFIRLNTEFKLDENGNRVTEGGVDVMRELTPEEKAEREADAVKIRNAIAAYEAGGNLQMSTEMFEGYLEKYGSGNDYLDKNGYFFHENSYVTYEFNTEFPKVVNAALYMETESFKEVEAKEGVLCFVYKMAFDRADRNYLDTSKENVCFSDFYTDAMSASFAAMIETLSKDVELLEAYGEFDFIKIPYNTDYIPRI